MKINAQQWLAIFILLNLSVLCFSQFISSETFIVCGQSDSASSSFSLMQITDTQHLSDTQPYLFQNLTDWISNNSKNYNLRLVIHTGDIVDNATDASQWKNANDSMGILLDAGIPYCWSAGNHDQFGVGVGFGNPNLDWLGSRYLAFNAMSKRAQSFWVDDCFDSKNTAVSFTKDEYPFLILNIEYHANSSVIAWMRGLLDKNPNSNVVIATHSYLNETAGYGKAGDWESNLRILLDEYSNVFLTMNGHYIQGTANMTKAGNREEIFFNRQTTGAAAVRIYIFDLEKMKVSVETYNLYTSSFMDDPYNNFTFNVALKSDKLPSNPLPSVLPDQYYNWLTPKPTSIKLTTPSPIPLLSSPPNASATETTPPGLSRTNQLPYNLIIVISSSALIALPILYLVFSRRNHKANIKSKIRFE